MERREKYYGTVSEKLWKVCNGMVSAMLLFMSCFWLLLSGKVTWEEGGGCYGYILG